MLVNLAMERDEDIPALVYEAREVRRTRRQMNTPSEGVAEGLSLDSAGTRFVGPQSTMAVYPQTMQRDVLFEGVEGHWGSGANTGTGRSTFRGGRALGESRELRGETQESNGSQNSGQAFGRALDSELVRLHLSAVRFRHPRLIRIFGPSQGVSNMYSVRLAAATSSCAATLF